MDIICSVMVCVVKVTSSCVQELVVGLGHLVVQYESNFCTVALQFMEEEKNYAAPSLANTTGVSHTHRAHTCTINLDFNLQIFF